MDREIWKTHVMWRPDRDNMNSVNTNNAINDTMLTQASVLFMDWGSSAARAIRYGLDVPRIGSR